MIPDELVAAQAVEQAMKKPGLGANIAPFAGAGRCFDVLPSVCLPYVLPNSFKWLGMETLEAVVELRLPSRFCRVNLNFDHLEDLTFNYDTNQFIQWVD